MKKLVALLVACSLMVGTSSVASATNTNVDDNSARDRQIVEELKRGGQPGQGSPMNSQVSLQLSPNEEKFWAAYNEYQSLYGTKSLGEEDLNAFADYAVENGIIADTPEARGELSKSVVRASFKLGVAAGGFLNLDMAVDFLDHSLQDNPNDLSFARGSKYSNEIKDSEEYKTLIANIKDKLAKETDDLWSEVSSITLNSTKDLLLALNKVDYIAGAEKVNGRWTIHILFTDDYNFEHWKWSNVDSLNSALVTALNNYGDKAEEIGAIVGYHINIYT